MKGDNLPHSIIISKKFPPFALNDTKSNITDILMLNVKTRSFRLEKRIVYFFMSLPAIV